MTHLPPGQESTVPRQSSYVVQTPSLQNWVDAQSDVAVHDTGVTPPLGVACRR